MAETLDRATCVTEAILNYSEGHATVHEIAGFCSKYYPGLFDNTNDAHMAVYRYLRRKPEKFVQTNRKGRGNERLWTIKIEKKLQLEKQKKPPRRLSICPDCTKYSPLSELYYNGEEPFYHLETCRNSNELITTAILSQPLEQATTTQIRKFLQKNIPWLWKDPKMGTTLSALLTIRNAAFVKTKIKRTSDCVNLWRITAAWRQQIEQGCKNCMMVRDGFQAFDFFNNTERFQKIEEPAGIQIIDLNTPIAPYIRKCRYPLPRPASPSIPRNIMPQYPETGPLPKEQVYQPVMQHPETYPNHLPEWQDHNPSPNAQCPQTYPPYSGNNWNDWHMQIPRNIQDPYCQGNRHAYGPNPFENQYNSWENQDFYQQEDISYIRNPNPVVHVIPENEYVPNHGTMPIVPEQYPSPISTVLPSAHERNADISPCNYPVYLGDAASDSYSTELPAFEKSNQPNWTNTCPSPNFIEAYPLAGNTVCW